ncbi:MAG: hypothetical protein KAJ63_04835, partial [Methyloprofundus sp.]|nr:hypothetical protein [Methyloprofundus sp.]
VILRTGFRAMFGSHLVANTQLIAAKIRLAKTLAVDTKEQLTSSDSSISETSYARQLTLDSVLAGIIQQPPVINGITLNPEQLSGLDFDSKGLSWVFATTQAFVLEDQNGLSDIYLLNRETGSIILISHSADNISGEGDSLYPVMDSDGHYIVFQSNANNLLSDDENPGSDIFVYVSASGNLLKLSGLTEDQTKVDFAHPAIDDAALILLYEGLAEEANSYIEVYDYIAQEKDVISSNTVNYYYPVISHNGRYQAYLEVDAHEGACTVHWRDNTMDVEVDTDCVGIKINTGGLLRFSYNNEVLEWRDSLWSDSKLDIKNPFKSDGL